MAQPFADDSFDAAVMPLVIFLVPEPRSPGASRIDAMRDLWEGAGLEAVRTREFAVQRAFADFDDYWATAQQFGDSQLPVRVSRPRFPKASAQQRFRQRAERALQRGRLRQLAFRRELIYQRRQQTGQC